MLLGAPWLVVGHVLSAIGSIALLWYIRSYWDRPGAKMWIGVLIIMSLWSVLYGAALLLFEQKSRMLLELAIWVCITWISVFFLGFALTYTGRGHLLDSWPMRGLVMLQGTMTALLLSNPVHHLLFSDFRIVSGWNVAGVLYTKEPMLFGIIGTTYLAVGIGIILLIEAVASYGPAYRRQAVAIAVTPLFPVGASLVWLFELGPVPQLNFTALFFLPHLLLDVYALFGRDMFELPPATRRIGERAAIDDLGNPVFITTDDGRVIDFNTAAEQVSEARTETTNANVLRQHISGILGEDLNFEADEQQISLFVDGKRRTFKIVPSSFETESSLYQGYTITMQDMTREIQRKQRLEVLNRILRHNLRNDLNVVRLRAEQLSAKESDPDRRAQLATIESMATNLVELGEKARTAVQAMEDISIQTVEIQPLLSHLVSNIQTEYPDATVELNIPNTLVLESDSHVLSLIFESAIENGIEHSEDPVVSVTARRPTRDDRSVVFEITDNGPGIPDHELSVIEGGSESALDHASGVGLWLIQWGVTILGGSVSFDVTDNGTTVTIRLPTSETDMDSKRKLNATSECSVE